MRLALWFTVAIVLLLCAFALVFFFALKPAMEAQTAQSNIAEATRIAGEVEYDPLTSGVMMEGTFKSCEEPYFSVYSLDGRVIERNHVFSWIDEVPIELDETRKVVHEGAEWSFYDMYANEDDMDVAVVRVAEKLDAVDAAMGQTLMLFAIMVPVACVAAVGVGLAIARRALRPVDEITRTARAIAAGDLSQRVEVPRTHDEVGRLATTFNSMIASTEAALGRERRFASDASHELRTPLAVILAAAEEGLEAKAEDGGGQRALETIRVQGEHMQGMLAQLLALARYDEQREAMEIREFNLASMLADIADTFEEPARERNVTLHIDCPAGLQARADIFLLTRALTNLVDNAIRYGRVGGHVWIEAGVERGVRGVGGKGGDLVCIGVRDDGPGIAGEHLPHIFERFYRGDAAHSGSAGTGLGLAMVRHIAELHGGSVEARNAPGGDMVFYLKLPQ
jgi:signal transduction histidine kinase